MTIQVSAAGLPPRPACRAQPGMSQSVEAIAGQASRFMSKMAAE